MRMNAPPDLVVGKASRTPVATPVQRARSSVHEHGLLGHPDHAANPARCNAGLLRDTEAA